MKIAALIRGLSIATVLLVAGSPAYGASIFITAPEVKLDDDPILKVVGRPGDTITWSGFIDTRGLTANLESITMYSASARASDGSPGPITGFKIEPNPDQPQFFPSLEEPTSLDPNTGLTTLVATRTGPPGLPPNRILRIGDITITLGDQSSNTGKVDYRIGVLSAIDANGRDITDQFKPVYQEFEVQIVPEPSPVVGTLALSVLGAGLVFKRRFKMNGTKISANTD